MIGAKKDCVRCKGRGYCGLDFCPIHTKARALFRVKDLLKTKDFSGSAPTPFVGRYGYPHVNVGILSPPEIREDAWTFDAPRYWSDKGYNAEAD